MQILEQIKNRIKMRLKHLMSNRNIEEIQNEVEQLKQEEFLLQMKDHRCIEDCANDKDFRARLRALQIEMKEDTDEDY